MPLVAFTGEPQGREFIAAQEPAVRYTWGGEDTRRGWGYPTKLPLSMRLRQFGPGANIGRKGRRGIDDPAVTLIPLEEEAAGVGGGGGGGAGTGYDYGGYDYGDGWGGGGGGGGGWTPREEFNNWFYGLTTWRF